MTRIIRLSALSAFVTLVCVAQRGLAGGREGRRGERCGVLGHPVRNNQMPAAQETAAVVNEVGDVAFALVLVGLDERLTQAANDFGRVVTLGSRWTPASVRS
jgi:hypothetical protein